MDDGVSVRLGGNWPPLRFTICTGCIVGESSALPRKVKPQSTPHSYLLTPHSQNIPNALNKFRHLCYTNSTLIRGGMKNGAF